MKEELLQFIWQFQLFRKDELRTDSGESLEIIKVGNINIDSGPDFTNAKIRIGRTVWAGNIEIHKKSSDWSAHKHQNDKAYDNVILHVVQSNDVPVVNSEGRHMATFVVPVEERLLKNFSELQLTQRWLACEERILEVNNFHRNLWLNRLLVERLEERAVRIQEELLLTDQNWEESFYRLLARNFGFNINSEPFLLLARALPLKYLAKHKNNLLQVEAMLFGVAGLLPREGVDAYVQELIREYAFLSKKYRFKSLEIHLWKFFRVRPVAFPTVRLAQFASLVYESSFLLSRCLESDSIADLSKLFSNAASLYWDTHYVFHETSNKKVKKLGKSSVNNILINTVLPFMFFYGKLKIKNSLSELAIELYHQLEPEKNRITKQWDEVGVKASTAGDSQALIQLKKYYCSQRKCLNCQIGHKLIRN